MFLNCNSSRITAIVFRLRSGAVFVMSSRFALLTHTWVGDGEQKIFMTDAHFLCEFFKHVLNLLRPNITSSFSKVTNVPKRIRNTARRHFEPDDVAFFST